MPIRAIKYLSPITFYTITILSFYRTGFFSWLPLFYSFGLIPFLELWVKNDHQNLSKVEEDLAKHNFWYDIMLYIIVPMQYFSLYLFFQSFTEPNLGAFDITGRISAMGLLCGIFGINVGHELGHRANIWEQRMAKALLLSSLYMHFFIEHNKGHHKNVATPNDPASSRLNEPIYTFYFRTIWYSYLSAWKIAHNDLIKKGFNHSFFKNSINWRNEMLQTQLIQILFIFLIGYFFGVNIMLYFLVAAFIGALLLETVNYIEHYGLQRKRSESGIYERTMPIHSWNSDHVLGRIFLFELSRHSDHHYMASRKYQILKSHENAPQLPTGYPGSMLLSLIPPLWFKVMNKRIAALQ
jgi:alkane 1-monooxygenase